jgi:hypothetical protein
MEKVVLARYVILLANRVISAMIGASAKLGGVK